MGERILYANDVPEAREGISKYMGEYVTKGAHVFLGGVSSVEELKTVLLRGYKPTVFLLDPYFPNLEEGIEAIGIMNTMSPDTKIATLPSVMGIPRVDKRFYYPVTKKEILNYLNNIKH